MDLKKIPPSMLIVLGLGATEACVQPCLSPPVDDTSPPQMETNSTGGSSTGMDTRPGTEVGPCLSIGEESTAASGPGDSGTSTGSGSGSGTMGGSDSGGSDSGTTSGSGGEGGSTVGPCLAPPGIVEEHEPLVHGASAPSATPAASRKAALDRLLDRDALPADIAARLRRDLDE